MTFPALPGNLARVGDDIARIQAREGLAGPIRIVAVTKGHGPTAVRAAVQAGVPDVGESRVQEAVEKLASLDGLTVSWHLIGHLQTNKAKLVPGRFAMVHSVDSSRLAEELAKHEGKRGDGVALPVLIQVNVAGEEQKSGVAPAALEPLAAQLANLPGLELRGLMTMAPLTDDEGVQRRVFATLRELRDRLTGAGFSVPELSMGMSNDYPAAVAEGATILRLGTVLFGERPR